MTSTVMGFLPMSPHDDEWDGIDRRARQSWRVKKEISLGDIVAIVTAFVAVMMAYSTLDKRIQRQEDIAVAQREVDRRQDEEQLRSQGRIEQSIRALDDKLERILERTRTRPFGDRVPP